MNRATVLAIAALVLAFLAGWKVAIWQRDSLELVIEKSATATGKKLEAAASQSARELEGKLDEIRNAPPREIRTELVKPVFTNVCLSAEFVSMYNDAAAKVERALSGKPENKMPRATATPDGQSGK
ncbi:hypothetical protein [Buttiauxella sp. A111]|uniref:hypothetical protein n=1 Tax=Buttiauxella sp. A111 TaxID=2563088 RepID=UPI0010F1BCD0|nr:hypothetical protein [Buttiauxella sp. A111]GDX05729.1 hypothetical protein BSPA111_19300 [Buttiauxella sp. A111]